MCPEACTYDNVRISKNIVCVNRELIVKIKLDTNIHNNAEDHSARKRRAFADSGCRLKARDVHTREAGRSARTCE